MKKIIKAVMFTALILMIFSCDLVEEDPEALVEDRIDDFESDLNDGNYDDLTDHFHPDMVSYDSYMDSSIIANGPLGTNRSSFKFGSPDISESGSKYDAEGSFESDVVDDGSYSAVMKEDGDDWKILSIDITVGIDTYEIRTLK